MRRFLIPLIGLTVFSSSASADIVGVWAGANYWHYDVSGTARYRTSDSANDIDTEDDLGYDDSSTAVIYAALEHPVPVLPNVRVVYTNIDDDADGRLSRSFVFGGITYVANEAVSSEVKLKQTDITFYYSPLDNLVNLDLGLTAKYIDSELRITGETSGTERSDVSAWVPMLYAGVGVDLPLSGLSVGAEGSAVGYDGSRFYDVTLRATYETSWRLGIDVGYRTIGLDLDDIDNSFAAVKFSGPYAGAYLHF